MAVLEQKQFTINEQPIGGGRMEENFSGATTKDHSWFNIELTVNQGDVLWILLVRGGFRSKTLVECMTRVIATVEKKCITVHIYGSVHLDSAKLQAHMSLTKPGTELVELVVDPGRNLHKLFENHASKTKVEANVRRNRSR